MQIHYPSANLRDIRLRQLKYIAVYAVKAHGNIAGQLNMLLLVGAYGYIVRLIKKDIRGLERRICEKPGVNIFRVFLGFVFKLRHALQLPEHCVAI